MISQLVIDTATILLIFLARVGLPMALVLSIGYWIQRRLRVENFAEEPASTGRGLAGGRRILPIRLVDEVNGLPAWLPTVAILTLIGLVFSVYRLRVGLGETTHLNQAYPWGLWIAITLFMIAFSSGTFTLPVIVYVLNLREFRAGLRPTILIGLLGYAAVTLTMILGLGRWDRFIYLIEYPNITSPLSLCFWCIMLYTMVLTIEFIPAGHERTRWSSIKQLLRQARVVLAIVGATLALTFQFSLGTVFVIAAQRIHPLWHTPLLPLIFLVSSINAGLGMVIAGGTCSYWTFGRCLRQDLIERLAGWLPWTLGAYLAITFWDLYSSGDPILTSGVPTVLYLAEVVVGSVVPFIMFSSRSVRESRRWSFIAAAALLFGVLMNRLDVAWLSTAAASGVIYMPSLVEIGTQIGLLSLVVLIYTLAGHYLPLFEGLAKPEREAQLTTTVESAY